MMRIRSNQNSSEPLSQRSLPERERRVAGGEASVTGDNSFVKLWAQAAVGERTSGR